MLRGSRVGLATAKARQLVDFMLLSANARRAAMAAAAEASATRQAVDGNSVSVNAPASAIDLEQLPKGAVLITGAGVSTASGIPDYRGPQGLYEKGHRPMTFQRFTSGAKEQRRYWARSFLGYPTMCRRQPNPAHVATAALLNSGAVSHVITQNVDGLHGEAQRKAGATDTTPLQQPVCRSTPSAGISELHGNIHRVRCLKCNDVTTRPELQRRFAEENAALLRANPHLAEAGALHDAAAERDPGADFVPVGEKPESAVLELGSEKPSPKDRVHPTGSVGLGQATPQQLRPDGDFEAEQGWIDQFKIVPCAACGEFALKPDMVFFGESTDRAVVAECFEHVLAASCVICVGTSMQVFSAYRFVVRARDHGIPVAILNSGPTRADKDAALLVDGQVDAVLPYVALRFIGSNAAAVG